MSERVPRLQNDEDAESFLDQDLSKYLDPADMQRLHFKAEPKDRERGAEFT
ncbi:MAG: hypothetical protein KIT00_00210 [Rhodospirillales bacterium]|nr:hypothetical protein [Rhodospirillales bacterium]